MRYTLIVLLISFSFCMNAQVAINTNSAAPHPSAMLDVQSSNKGLLPPRMNYDAIVAITNPAAGLQVYDTTYNCLRYFNGVKWVKLVGEVKEPADPQGESALYGQGAGEQVYIEDICSDSSGNIYAAGWFVNMAKFGNIIFNTNPNSSGDAFLVKYDKNGKVVWAKQFGTANEEQFKSIVYSNSSVCVTGIFSGPSVMIGNISLSNSGAGALMVVKFDTNGNPLWGQAMNGSGVNRIDAITADASGNFYVAGKYNGPGINFGGGFTHTNTGAYDAFIVKYSNGGTIQWTKQIGGTVDEKLFDIICYGNTIAATGYFESPSVVLNSFTLTNPGTGTEMMVMKLDLNGVATWAVRLGVAGVNEIGKALTVDETGTLYVVGEYELGNTIIGSSSLANKGTGDGMLVRITTAGVVTAYPINSAGRETVTGIAYCNSFVYVCGYSTAPPDLNVVNKTYPVISRGSNEIFIARIFAPMPTIAQYQWMQQQGGLSNDYVTSICVDPLAKDIYTAGRCELAPAIFGSATLYNNGYYLWRYTPEQ